MPKQIFHSICFSENEHSLIHQSPFDRTFEAWKPIAINQNYNQKEFLNTHHNYILSPGRAVGTGGARGQWLPKNLADHKRGGGADYAHQITTRPPSPRIFRPSYGPARPHCTVSSLCKLLHVHSKQCHIYGTPRTSIFIQRSEKNTSPSIRSLDLHGHIAT